MVHDILVVFHIFLCIGLIGFILIQHGKGADAGAAFGSGASATVFGSRGSASFLTRTTAILATLFFLTSLTLAYFSGQRLESKSVVDKVPSSTTTQSSTAPETKVTESEVPMPVKEKEASNKVPPISTDVVKASDTPDKVANEVSQKSAVSEPVKSESPAIANSVTTPSSTPVETKNQEPVAGSPVETKNQEPVAGSPVNTKNQEIPTNSPTVDTKNQETSSSSTVDTKNQEIPTNSPTVDTKNQETPSSSTVDTKNQEIPTNSPTVDTKNQETPSSSTVDTKNQEIPTSSPTVETKSQETPTGSPTVESKSQEIPNSN
jgi:preprotein translocase subunit SecG